MNKIALTICILLSFALTGCGLHAYRINVQQGNVITQNMVVKLRPGMTKQQVKAAIGAPVLNNAFSKDYWTYAYTNQIHGGAIARKQLVLYFKNNRLVRIGDSYPRLPTPQVK